MKKKGSLKEADEIKAAEESRVDEEDERSPVERPCVPPQKVPVEERGVSFNLGDLEEIPEHGRLARAEVKETSLDGGELILTPTEVGSPFLPGWWACCQGAAV